MVDNYPMGVNGSDPYFNQQDEPETIEARDLSNMERLAIVQAFYKTVANMVKTKTPDNLRGAVDAEMEERFYQAKELGLAPKSFDVELFGRKVGSYSITTTKDEPSTVRVELNVTDTKAFNSWAIEHGMFAVDWDMVNSYFARTGEVPDGCEPQTVHVPGVEGGAIKQTRLTVDEAKVALVLGPQLGAVSQLLLEGELQ